MKKTLLAVMIAGAATTAFAADTVTSLDTKEQKISYGFGVMLGKRMSNEIPNLDMDVFVKGMSDAYAGKAQMLTDDEIGQMLAEYRRDLQEEQMAKVQELSKKNQEIGQAFLADNQNKEGVVTLASGLQYKVLQEGKGVQPGPVDVVKVHYTGSLINGEVFDSSVQRGEPVSFPVNGVIAGWTEALQLMPTGSKWQLFIPANLAYGPNGTGRIGPNETLLFEVELLEVQQKN